MRKILVTGAFGQLGSELKVLSAGMSGFDFLFTDFDTLDVTDKLAVAGCIKDYRPDFVINCAAYTAVDKAEQDKELCFRLNAGAPAILAAACGRSGSGLIHISTDYVFDGTSSVPYKEDDPVNPQGNYGASKREGELACLENPDTLIIRTSWLYSSFGHNFVKTILRLGRDKDQLNVVFDQVGTPTYAADLASAIMAIISQSAEEHGEWKPGIYHYSNEGVCSWYDFALAILRTGGIKCRVYPVESKDFVTLAKRPGYSVLNKSKIKNSFHLTIPHWQDSLERCMRKLKPDG